MAKILIVDDDPSLREVLEIALHSHDHAAENAANIDQALSLLAQEVLDLAIVDLRLGQESGLDLLKTIKQKWPSVPVLMITAYADSQTAIKAIKLGAEDYIAKPFDVEEFLLQVDRLLENSRLAEENVWLKEQLHNRYGQIIGNSEKMNEVYSLVSRIAPTSINVLITGESGTGKELIARAIHENSPRKDKAFMVINCGGVPENLVESELFGYRKGAFTGANQSKKGLLEKSDKGTFMLDEVGELSASIQVKLLRCLQDGTFMPLGSTELTRSDIRFIAATNREIEKEVSEGRFREDLFYRLCGVMIKMPPLRERGEDLFLLAEHFLKQYCQEQNKEIKGFTTGAMQKLRNYHYPGNIRELETIIERAVALESGPYISPGSLIIYEQVQSESMDGTEKVLSGELGLDEYLEQVDKKVLLTALERTQGHKSKAAELVGLNFRQFRYRLNKYNLSKDDR